MLITKDFIMLNLPKTGSTFTRTVIKKLYRDKYESFIKKVCYKLRLIDRELIELRMPNIKMPNKSFDQHGTFSQIPHKYLNKQIVTTIRNPYSRFLSNYEFRSWANPKQLTVDEAIIDEKFPTFPDLGMDDYVDLCVMGENTRLKFITGNPENINELGEQTIQFVQMYFKDPKAAIVKMDSEYINSGKYKKDMANIQFLKQEHLKDDLYSFLLQFNFTEKELAFIKDYKKMNVTKSKVKDRMGLWTTKAIEYVTNRERFLIQILKDLGIDYPKPEF